MLPGDDAIAALQQALAVSPGNLPLLMHLAATFASLGRHAEAEAHYKRAISQAPGDAGAMLGLARAYEAQGKGSHALVILEELAGRKDCPAAARMLLARVALKQGDAERAARQYRLGVAADPSLADALLAGELGIAPGPAAEAAWSAGEDAPEGGGAGGPGAGADERLRAGHHAEDDGQAAAHLEKPTISFADIGGMDGVKEEIRAKIIHPLAHPELYKAYGKQVGGGILLYGPPGCGKTLLARATAGEVRARFVVVGIADVLDMWIGNSEKNLRAVFRLARSNAPCVLFFDEVDALGASRADLRQSGGRQLINQFLSELDGVGESNDGVLILAATNAPWHLDSAFRRPGRFDRILFVPPPDGPARAAILRVLLKGKPTKDVDFDGIAKRTEGFSGADLRGVVDRAVESRLREAIAAGRPQPVLTGDLLAAAKGMRPSTGEWFASARNHALYANEGGLYDEVLRYLRIS